MVEEIKINNSKESLQYLDEFIKTFKEEGVFFKIIDERSRWFGSIVFLPKTEYDKREDLVTAQFFLYYNGKKISTEENIFNSFYYNNRFVRKFENKYYEMKIKPGTAVWLRGYTGKETIIKEAPEARMNNKYLDMLKNPISIGATVIASDSEKMYLGTVKNFKVGPSNTYVHITPAKLDENKRYPDKISAHISNVLVVTKDIGEKILIAKLSS